MDNKLHSALFRSADRLLRPLVNILIRNGIAYASLADLLRKVYVDVAFERFTLPGKKQTVSRVAALTGISRKETKRLHELHLDGDAKPSQRYNRATRVITGWLNDAEFLDTNGNPAVLPVDGDSGSFHSLAKKYSGDVPTQAMLNVLRLAGTLAEQPDRHVKLVKTAYIPGSDPIDKIDILGTDVCELLSTIDHNLTAPKGQLFFQRKVSNYDLSAKELDAFRALSAEKAQILLEELDHWLSEHEAKKNQGHYVSLGIFYSDDTIPIHKDKSKEKGS